MAFTMLSVQGLRSNLIITLVIHYVIFVFPFSVLLSFSAGNVYFVNCPAFMDSFFFMSVVNIFISSVLFLHVVCIFKRVEFLCFFVTIYFFYLTLIVLGGKSNLIVLGGGQICPNDFFGVFITKFKSKTNFKPIL